MQTFDVVQASSKKRKKEPSSSSFSLKGAKEEHEPLSRLFPSLGKEYEEESEHPENFRLVYHLNTWNLTISAVSACVASFQCYNLPESR
jgi:hypothetical protein